MKLVTVYQTFSSADAHLIRSLLDAAELHPTVENEMASLWLDCYSLGTGGILVKVPAEEVEAARELIEQEPAVLS